VVQGQAASACFCGAVLLGLDPEKLSYFYGGLDQKLVGVEGAEAIRGALRGK
jgi:hypothetical protein